MQKVNPFGYGIQTHSSNCLVIVGYLLALIFKGSLRCPWLKTTATPTLSLQNSPPTHSLSAMLVMASVESQTASDLEAMHSVESDTEYKTDSKTDRDSETAPLFSLDAEMVEIKKAVQKYRYV